MNQFAFTKQGEMNSFWFKVDPFSWIGVDEEIYDYIKDI